MTRLPIDMLPAGVFPGRIEIHPSAHAAMLAHVRACLPEEACGILGGRWMQAAQEITALTQVVIPIQNELHSPVRFRMDPAEQLEAFLSLEQQAFELVAIFHSHPTGPDRPSPTDIAEFFYPGVLTLIWSPGGQVQPDDWRLRGFQISDGTITEVRVSLIDRIEPPEAEAGSHPRAD